MTIRSLAAMAQARQKDAWLRNAALMALIFNRTRFFSKEQEKKPDDFNPFAPQPKPVSVKEKFAAMKLRFLAFVQQQTQPG